jgi:hypothetical protein
MNTPDWAGTNDVIESGGHPVANQQATTWRRKDGPAVRPYLCGEDGPAVPSLPADRREDGPAVRPYRSETSGRIDRSSARTPPRRFP